AKHPSLTSAFLVIRASRWCRGSKAIACVDAATVKASITTKSGFAFEGQRGLSMVEPSSPLHSLNGESSLAGFLSLLSLWSPFFRCLFRQSVLFQRPLRQPLWDAVPRRVFAT